MTTTVRQFAVNKEHAELVRAAAPADLPLRLVDGEWSSGFGSAKRTWVVFEGAGCELPIGSGCLPIYVDTRFVNGVLCVDERNLMGRGDFVPMAEWLAKNR